MTTYNLQSLGSDPVNIKWSIIRGDSSKIRIDFLEIDEKTTIDISDWDCIAMAYDVKNDNAYDLEITAGNGYLDIFAPADTTAEWGSGYGSQIGQLLFDVQVTFGDTVWTPVNGTILVLGDVSGTL